MSHLFTPNPTLLHPQFETYRLHSLDPDEDVRSYPLPGSGATQSRLGYNQHHLSFKEVRSRISWDHLAIGQGGRGVYVDADWDVIGFQLDEELQPEFCELAALPKAVDSASSSSSAALPEYPSVLPLDDIHWAVATGSGTLYILETTPAYDPVFRMGDGFIARYDLTSSTGTASPFLIRATHRVSSNEVSIVLQRSVAPDAKGKRRAQSTAFELLQITLDPLAVNAKLDEEPGILTPDWIMRGGDAPFWCEWWDQGWLILCGEEMRDISADQDGDGDGEVEAEAGFVPRLGVGMMSRQSERTVDQTGDEVQVNGVDEEKVWPFSWTQSPESVSVTIPFPAGTTRSDLNISLTATSFCLSLESSTTPSSPLFAFLAKPTRQLWTTILPSESTWTYNPDKSQLEVDLAKVDQNTRWPSVFSPPDPDEDDDAEEEEVPETLSAATLSAVRQTFHNIRTREPGEPEGNPTAIPALLREEMDFDLDDDGFGEERDGVFADSAGGKVGREVYVGYVKDGKASWSRTVTSVLSTPLNNGHAGVMVKSAVDGLCFDPKINSDPSKDTWTHTSTNPALAFVLSSKRDLRVVRHLSTAPPLAVPSAPEPKNAESGEEQRKTTVLAFDSGSSETTTGNVYVYYPPNTGGSANSAKQGVVRISGADRGALLGVGLLEVGKTGVVVALCEKELVVLNGVV